MLIIAFEWYKRFIEGQEEVKDNTHLGPLTSTKTDQTIEIGNQIVWNDSTQGETVNQHYYVEVLTKL